ncbi:MAG: hypothetical protein RMI01_08795, partial [Thermodesulfovibrio sp.]|nr:hypothetical protein [Thermodesulfovibrio sp.]
TSTLTVAGRIIALGACSIQSTTSLSVSAIREVTASVVINIDAYLSVKGRVKKGRQSGIGVGECASRNIDVTTYQKKNINVGIANKQNITVIPITNKTINVTPIDDTIEIEINEVEKVA